MLRGIALIGCLAVADATCPADMPTTCVSKGNCQCVDVGSFYFYKCGLETCNNLCEGCNGPTPAPRPKPAPTPTPKPTPAPAPPTPVPGPPACIAKRGSDTQAVSNAVAWACGNMPRGFDCNNIPSECKGDTFMKADYVFGVYFSEAGSIKPSVNCDFSGIATFAEAGVWTKLDVKCVVVKDPTPPATPTTPPAPPTPPPTPGPAPGPSACIAKRGSDPAAVKSAVNWACNHMPRGFDCNNIPVGCKGDTFKTADYAFGVYYVEVTSTSEHGVNCDFGGTATYATAAVWKELDAECVVVKDPSPPAPTPPPPTPSPTPPPPPPSPSPAPLPLTSMKSVCYGALPCSPGAPCAGTPPQDMVQAGYEMQWGSKGRDDLGMIKALGGNAVRLYHSIGLESEHDHAPFLNYAQQLGLHVLPGMHTNMACNDFDCFDSWKAAVLKSFKNGFKQDNRWHESIATMIIMNEPDFFNMQPNCPGQADWCRCKAALSALDGVLAAEKEAGVQGNVNLTITWSFGQRTSIDGVVSGPGVYGFQDMVAIIKDPSKAQYTPKSSHAELAEAFRTRWVHSLNAAAPYNYIKSVVNQVYKQFEPHPWFIGEHGMDFQTHAVIEGDLQASDQDAQGDGYYMGLSVFQFQQSYQKGNGGELNFGIFSLGDSKIGQTDEVFENGGQGSTWPVHCLNTNLDRDGGLTDATDHRAEAVAKGWGGSAVARGRCSALGAGMLLV